MSHLVPLRVPAALEQDGRAGPGLQQGHTEVTVPDRLLAGVRPVLRHVQRSGQVTQRSRWCRSSPVTRPEVRSGHTEVTVV